MLKTERKFQDCFTAPKGVWALHETAPEEQGYDRDIYCARLRGPVALVEGVSLNNRFYSRSLWEKVIKENGDRLSNEGLFGTLGHDQPIDEEALAKGLVSHKMTSLYVNEDTGTVDGEILVLNSSAGRELNTYLRSGMKIATSSRAFGQFKGKTKEGADIIDEEGFTLQGFDFVLNPGVESARPKLVESVDTVAIEEEQTKMPELHEAKLLESLEQRSKLQVDLYEAAKVRDEAVRALNEAKAENEKLSKELNEARQVVGYFRKHFSPKPVAALKELNEGLGKWLMVPDFQEIAKEIGMFDLQGTTMDQTIKKLVESLGQYSKLGTPKQFEKCLELLEAYKECGSTPHKVSQALDMLEAFVALEMSPEQITEKVADGVRAHAYHNKAKRIVAATKIRKENKLDESFQPQLLALLERGLKVKEVEEIAKSFSGRKIDEKKTTKTQPVPVKKNNVSPINESSAPRLGNAEGAMKLVSKIAYAPVVTK